MKQSEMTQQEKDDAIVVKGILIIREGIINGNWQQVCDGYNLIGEENLQPPEQNPKTKLDKIREAVNQKQTKTVEKIEKPKKTLKRPGRKPTHQKQILVIADPFDPEEAAKNEEMAKKKDVSGIQRSAPPKDQSKNENAEVRYIDNPTAKAPWR